MYALHAEAATGARASACSAASQYSQQGASSTRLPVRYLLRTYSPVRLVSSYRAPSSAGRGSSHWLSCVFVVAPQCCAHAEGAPMRATFRQFEIGDVA